MAKTIATTAIRIATRALTKDANAAHQCFRIKNLYKNEVIEFVKSWPETALRANLSKVRLVVADNLNGMIPPEYTAEDGYSITHYRNHNPDGLIYIETSVQSDAQGLQNMFSLHDSNFLDGSFDEYSDVDGGVPGQLIYQAWNSSGGIGPAPGLMVERLLQLIKLIHPSIEPVPVRRYIAFVENVCKDWLSNPNSLDESGADDLIGSSLWLMDMFQDPTWKAGGVEQRVRRRLELNLRYADLIDGNSELDGDAIFLKAKSTKFVDIDGNQLSVDEGNEWRELCIKYGRSPSADLRRQIPYSIFSQLFEKDTTGLRLGDRVRAEIESNDPSRLAEYDLLDVTSGLNSRNSHDANRFLEAPSGEELKFLIDLISQQTRKIIERLAVPPRRRFFNPAIELVRLVQRISGDFGGRDIASIEMQLGDEAFRGSPTHGLFVFLFATTLKAIANNQNDVLGGCRLEMKNGDFDSQKIPKLVSDDDLESVDIVWDALPLRFTIKDRDGNIIDVVDQMEWHSNQIEHFAMMWLLVADPDSHALNEVCSLKLKLPADSIDWINAIVSREWSVDIFQPEFSLVRNEKSEILNEFQKIRCELKAYLSSSGIDVEKLQEYVDSWQSLLLSAREELSPEGKRSNDLDDLLSCDFVFLEGSDRRMMLSFHPLRLRWISRYLEESRKLAERFLSGDALFADGRGDFYLDWLEKLSPRECPPIAVGNSGQLMYSRAEVAWCEEYSPLISDSGDVAFDSDVISSITGKILNYLDRHPYKKDGLSLLVILPPSDEIPAEILKRISAKAGKNTRISLHIAVPKNRWEAISRSVEKLVTDSDGAPRLRLFPECDLSFIDYRVGDSLEERLSGWQIDIAVVTHILQEQIISQQNTEAPIPRPGNFDSLRHRPLRMEASNDGGAISLVMLPKYPDTLLESWSTLVVRANRSRPVAPSQPENTDFVELRVNFQDSARLFKDLHEHCHWVITLERHISREQIESIEAGSPDVLSIEDGIGANRLNTLVVSSRSGKELIQTRLVRKLKRLVPSMSTRSNELLKNLAQRVYESTRLISPKLALEALGVARVTEEILGLTVARNLADELFPCKPVNGVVAWISLDEHTDWFGGSNQVRADMCRISLERNLDGSIDIDLLVLEGKLRLLYDNHGVSQVKNTCDFFQAILGSDGYAGGKKVDALMWRELIATAIDSLSPSAIHINYSSNVSGISNNIDFRNEVVSSLRNGVVNLRKIDGVYSACLWDRDDSRILKSNESNVTVLKSTRFHLLDLLGSIDQENLKIFLAESKASVVPSDQFDLPKESNLDADSKLPSRINDFTQVNPGTPDVVNPETVSAEIVQAPKFHMQTVRGLNPNQLRNIYENILACYARFGIPVFAALNDEEPYVEGPASILFKVRPGPGVDPRKLYEKASALKLSLSLEQSKNISFNIDRGFVTIDVPKSDEQRYFVDAKNTWDRWQRPDNLLVIPIGEDRHGKLVELNFSSSNSPHLLVAGTTGSGKSEALNTILFGLTKHYSPHELRLLLVDPKQTELVPFEGCAYLEGQICWEDEQAIVLLKSAVEEMQRRYQLLRAAAARNLSEFNSKSSPEDKLPWWLIVLDEYADLTHDSNSKKEIEAELKRLAQKARAAGIHVIIATQKPSAEVISTNLRSNLPAQLALRVKSAVESRVVIDESGAENLNGMGDGLLKADGKLIRVQCSRVDPIHWKYALQGPVSND
jgi:S-DNA-T family DNA segregation ATPase FtsK/SpoIIIE